MITIDEKPDRPVCAAHGPLRWGYFTDTKQGARWVSFTFLPGGLLEPHVCDDPGRPPLRWAPSEAVADSAHRGAALARAVLAGDNPFTEEH